MLLTNVQYYREQKNRNRNKKIRDQIKLKRVPYLAYVISSNNII
jgi:hypothetical protein